MEKVKILQVNKLYYPEIGGIEKTLQQLSEGLSEHREVDLKVLVCQKKGRGKVELINGVVVHRSASLGVVASVPISFSFLLEFRKMAKDRDIVQLHLPFPLGDLACLLSGYKGKVIAFWHSDVVKQKKWMILYRFVMTLFLKRADLILVGAQGVADGSKYLKPYLSKCKVLPFAVENQILNAGKAYLDDYGYNRRHQILNFLFVGRLVYYKGCAVLMEAMAAMSEPAMLTVVGSGELEADLKVQCRKLAIEDKVKFTGNLSSAKINQCFETADVFILPSIERSEAFALVQLEAMAYGIPVINTNLPSGVPEVSVHMQTGYTVEPNDVEKLAQAMDWMATHSDERIVMGMRARKRVENLYTQERMITNSIDTYYSLIENGR